METPLRSAKFTGEKESLYHHLKLLNLVFYEMTAMLLVNLIGRAIPNIGNDEKDVGNSRPFDCPNLDPHFRSKANRSQTVVQKSKISIQYSLLPPIIA